LVAVEAFRRDSKSAWELLEGKNRPLETVEPGRALGWRSLDDLEIQLFELGFRVLVSSTRYAMLTTKPVEHVTRRLRASSLYISETSVNSLHCLDAFEKLLVGFSGLDDDFGLPVNGQDQRVPLFLSRSRSSEVLRLKSLSDRMSLAMSSMESSSNSHRI
jgi:hypothetical protein